MTDPSWRRYLHFWRPNAKADVDDELRFHIESRVQEYLQSGMTAEQARAEALRRFGDIELVRRVCEHLTRATYEDRRRSNMMDELWQDLRYTARALRNNLAFTIIAVATLTLGIGANTAIFSVVNGVLLRPLPYPHPDQLVRLYTAYHGSGDLRYSMSQPEFMDYRAQSRVFENAAAFTGVAMTLTGSGEPERVRGLAGTRDLFPVLGVTPARGRNFEGEEGRQGVEPVAIVTHEFWQNRFGGDPALLGRVLVLNGIARRVIGILPPDVTLAQAQVFIPIYINPDSLASRGSAYLSGVARMRPGVTWEQAQRELDALTRRVAQENPRAYPASMGYGATVVPMRDAIVGDVRPALLILLGAVGLVLLIACANVANLLLARGEARQREIAVRLALGASRARVLRQLLTESTMLAVLGAGLGAVLAWWGVKSLLAVNPDVIPRMELIGIDANVGVATAVLALATGVLFGFAPALQMLGTDLQSSLKEGTRGGTVGRGQQRLGRTLVAAEIGLAVVVVIGSALLMRSFWTLRAVDPGFDTRNLLVVDLAIPSSRYDTGAAVVFYQRLVQEMKQLPGVRGAAAASDIPPVATGYNWDIEIDGRPRVADQAAPSPNMRAVTPDYFRVMDIPAVRGRVFEASDSRGGAPVAVINQTTARRVFGDADPIGMRVRFGPKQPWITLVGVSRDTRSSGLGEPVPPEIFLVHEQLPAIAGGTERTMYVLVRASSDPMALAGPARRIVRELDPLLAITNIRSMAEVVDLSVARPRFTMLLLGVFGSVALLLAAIGIYGIMSYAVKRRTREIGIRMALGARPADIARLIVRQGMTLALSGMLGGVIVAFLATRAMATLLYGVTASDPLTYLMVVGGLSLVALAATWIPAHRALGTPPTDALRSE